MKDRTIVRDFTYKPSIVDGKRVFSPCYGPIVTEPDRPIVKRVKKKGKKKGRHIRRKASAPYAITNSRAHISL